MGKLIRRSGILIGIAAGVALVSLLTPEQKKRLKRRMLEMASLALVVSEKWIKEVSSRLPEAIEAGKKAAYLKEQELMKEIYPEVTEGSEPTDYIV